MPEFVDDLIMIKSKEPRKEARAKVRDQGAISFLSQTTYSYDISNRTKENSSKPFPYLSEAIPSWEPTRVLRQQW